MKALPKRKGNGKGFAASAGLGVGLNEGPSEKEGKSHTGTVISAI